MKETKNTSIALTAGSCAVDKDGYLVIRVPVAAALKNTDALTETESGKSLSISHPVNPEGNYVKFASIPVKLEDRTVEVSFNWNCFVTKKALAAADAEAAELKQVLANKAEAAKKAAETKAANAAKKAAANKDKQVQQLSYVPPANPELLDRMAKLEGTLNAIMDYLTAAK